jgi:hypothetical protein
LVCNKKGTVRSNGLLTYSHKKAISLSSTRSTGNDCKGGRHVLYIPVLPSEQTIDTSTNFDYNPPNMKNTHFDKKGKVQSALPGIKNDYKSTKIPKTSNRRYKSDKSFMVSFYKSLLKVMEYTEKKYIVKDVSKKGVLVGSVVQGSSFVDSGLKRMPDLIREKMEQFDNTFNEVSKELEQEDRQTHRKRFTLKKAEKTNQLNKTEMLLRDMIIEYPNFVANFHLNP